MAVPTGAVEAPPNREPRYSLVKSATVLEDLPRMSSFSWLPEACDGGGVLDPCDVATMSVTRHTGAMTFEPFGVWAGFECSTFGFASLDYEGRARRMLATTQSHWIETEFWNGTQAVASGWSNASLRDVSSDVVTNGPTSFVDGFACLEQALAQCSFGVPGMIHAPIQLVDFFISNGLVEHNKDTGKLESKTGNIVVPGSGYDGTGPRGIPATPDSTWAYATPDVFIRLGDIYVTSRPIDVVDRTQNDMTVLASRLAAATWNGCCLIAAEFDVAPCDIAGLGS